MGLRSKRVIIIKNKTGIWCKCCPFTPVELSLLAGGSEWSSSLCRCGIFPDVWYRPVGLRAGTRSSTLAWKLEMLILVPQHRPRAPESKILGGPQQPDCNVAPKWFWDMLQFGGYWVHHPIIMRFTCRILWDPRSMHLRLLKEHRACLRGSVPTCDLRLAAQARSQDLSPGAARSPPSL